jgi:hypothetical protein
LEDIEEPDDWQYAVAIIEWLINILAYWVEKVETEPVDLDESRKIELLQIKAKRLRDRTIAQIRSVKKGKGHNKVRWIKRSPRKANHNDYSWQERCQDGSSTTPFSFLHLLDPGYIIPLSGRESMRR